MPDFSLPDTTTGGSQTISAPDLGSAEAQAQQQGTWSPSAGTYGGNSFGDFNAATQSVSSGNPNFTNGQPNGGVFTIGALGGGMNSGSTGSSGAGGGLAQFAAATSGITQQQLAQQKYEFDAQLQFARDQMTQLGIPQLQINQFLAQMQQQQFQAQLQLAAQAQAYNQAATTAAMTGYYTPPSPVPSMTQYTSQNVWQPGQQNFGSNINQGGGALTWDMLSQMMKAAAPASYNDAAAKAMAFQNQGSQQGNYPLNLSQAQLDQIVATGTGGQVNSFAALSGVPGVWPSGGAGQATGTGYFVGTDGRIHVGSPSGTGQAGWGGGSGTLAATGWAPGTQSSDPNVFLQPPSQGTATGGGTGTSAGAPSTGAGALPDMTGVNPGQPGGSQMTMQLGQLLGQYNGVPTEAAREFQQTQAQQYAEFLQNLNLQQGQLGQQYLSTASQLQGPQNTFQLSNYIRGAQGNPEVPMYLQNLASNINTPAFQAMGSTPPTVQSAAGLAAQLSGQGSATPGWDYNQTLNTLQNIMQQGPQSLAPGSLERLTPEELQAFGSGLGAVGGSLPSFLQQYATSRVGQQAPITQTRLA